MMSLSIKKEYLLVVLLISLFFAKYLLEFNIKKDVPQSSLRQVTSYLSENDPEQAIFVALAVTFGFKEVASDFLFIQAIQHFGDWKQKPEKRFEKIYPLLQTISYTSVHFVPAYSFGALVLVELGYPDEAIKLLNTGIANNPRAFELWLYRDFTIRLFRNKEYKKAIEGMETALKIKDYPPALERILAYAYEKDGQIGKAIGQWQRVYNSTEDPAIKEICLRHIKNLNERR